MPSEGIIILLGAFVGPAIRRHTPRAAILYPRELNEGRHEDISAYYGWHAYRTARGDGPGPGVPRERPAPPGRW